MTRKQSKPQRGQSLLRFRAGQPGKSREQSTGRCDAVNLVAPGFGDEAQVKEKEDPTDSFRITRVIKKLRPSVKESS
jgi:hypothetical protein